MESKETAKIRQVIEELGAIVRTMPATIGILQEEIDRCQAAIMDIDHWLEINDFPVRVGGKMSKKIKELRIKRRDLKDNLTILMPIYDFFIEHESVFKQMDKLRGNIRKQVAYVNKERRYTPRVLFELFGQEPPANTMSAAMRKAEG
ncbi:hypothetical protein HSX37_16265|uniref:Uncharacterized protein n=1 Tax=Dendrosporobacter quercicolus TaxID=146817 RepID=A0A1G9ZSA9_9FIRM|nr:hypothetical protein [Dendrosporobacter quercicolus]NSL49591.1 hypothetical protein [Dendrosporobacter quercicolus DSM 1736]SDN23997.1 hypothetical protein SAMN04488502_11547 [Dendrosporobacter quercicolus]